MYGHIASEFEAQLLQNTPPPLRRPGKPAPVVITLYDKRWITTFRWGLIQNWAADADGSGQLYARAETLAGQETLMLKPSIQQELNLHRCIIPLTDFYQDVSVPGLGEETIGLTAQIHRPDHQLMAIAGVWDEWKPSDQGDPVHTFAMVSVPANEDVSKVHDRMPAILAKPDYDLWLNDDVTDARDLLPLLKPWPEPLEIELLER